jgi:uncharacterized protein DUF4058
MDPYLEPHWLDVHATLIAETRRMLNKSLPPGLVARIEERIPIESEQSNPNDDPIIERFIRVLDQDEQLITVVEFVSPTNKRSPGLEPFLQKRGELLAGGVHFVEIDLVRAGSWRALMRPGTCPEEAVSVYRAVVRTAGSRPGGYLFPIPLRQPLPEVPVPLRTGEEPVKLALQPLLNAVYDDGRYDQALNYSRQLEPAMDPEDAAWADELLRKAGRRR